MASVSSGKKVVGMGRNRLPIKLELPPRFLDDEVRCGYKVTSRMKRIWAIELDLLYKFDTVCTKHDIQYVALWGTALGVVRHGGFIPWDDDVDVGMDRQNYNKLCAVAASEFEGPYFFQNALTDRACFTPLARLRNSDTTAAIAGFDTPDFNNGIYIDIYVLDGLSKSRFMWRMQNVLKHVLLVPIQGYYCKKWPASSFGMRVGYLLKHFWRLLPFEIWCRLYELVLSMYTAESNRLGMSSSFLAQDWKSWILKSDLESTRRCPFEFLNIPLPGHIEEYLTRCYGDFRAFPPEAQRGCWHTGQVEFDPDVGFREFLVNS